MIKAVLSDTVAAQDFKKRMPFKVSGYRSELDYCCTVACRIFDPTETQEGWKNGDISLAGGWFAVLFNGQEQSQAYKNMMIIAHIDEDNLHLVKELPQTVKFVVELAE
ncbi:cyclophilin-like fold protein [Eubacteriaceae bacterium ES2]|nr:cyclophilin-like fold protein [Eubacteriaceae bacterium ES2]